MVTLRIPVYFAGDIQTIVDPFRRGAWFRGRRAMVEEVPSSGSSPCTHGPSDDVWIVLAPGAALLAYVVVQLL